MVTIYDVANQAGVSPKTVSRVINNDGPVSERTRDTVETAIKLLGYVPSYAARSMKSRKSGLIGLITGAISNSEQFSTSVGLPDLFIVKGAQRVIGKSNKTLLISDTGGKTDSVPSLLRTFQEHRVEGVLYVATNHKLLDTSLDGFFERKVLVNCYDNVGTPAVVPDDEVGQYILTKTVIAEGHRRIGYLTLDPRQVATKLRLAGFNLALKEANIDLDPNLVVPVDLFGAPAEHELISDALDKFFNLASPPTVICCGNDRLALRTYSILRGKSIEVPEQISVVGYDDHRQIAETLSPTLTTVELPYLAMGERAATTLLELLSDDEKTPTGLMRVSGSVVRRRSLTAPRLPTPSRIT